MSFRKLLIRVMLWALGLTAVAGALAALTGSEAIVRIVTTGVLAAVAAALIIPFSLLADREESYLSGLIGMLLVVFEFAGALGLVWDIFPTSVSFRMEEKIGMTLVFLAITALPAGFFLLFISKANSQVSATAGVALCTSTFVMLIISLWSNGPFSKEDEWYSTALVTATMGLIGVASLAGAGSKPKWRWVGVIASIVAMWIAIYEIWRDFTSPFLFAIIVIITSVAGTVAFANLCLLARLSNIQNWVRLVTLVAAVITAGLIDLITIGQQYAHDLPIAMNLAAASGIVASCGGLALIVLAWINRKPTRSPILSEIREVKIICPGCGKERTIPAGESTCATCGLKIDIEFEEPRCPKCDYLLFMLKSDHCPECGTLIVA